MLYQNGKDVKDHILAEIENNRGSFLVKNIKDGMIIEQINKLEILGEEIYANEIIYEEHEYNNEKLPRKSMQANENSLLIKKIVEILEKHKDLWKSDEDFYMDIQIFIHSKIINILK